MNKYFFLFLSLCTLAPLPAAAQRYRLAGVEAERIEVTRRWDARPDSTEADQLVAMYSHGVDSILSPVLGESDTVMTAGRPESLLSNFVADILREGAAQAGRKADVGLCNMGGLRGILPQGKVTYGDVLAVSPFENRLSLVSLNGQKLTELLAQIAAKGGEGVSGVRLTADKSGRLIHSEVGGRPICLDSVYVVATLDYLAEGNDGMTALRECLSSIDTGIAVRDLIADYIRGEAGRGRKVSARMEGRITIE